MKNDKSQYQVVLFLLGEKGSGKTYIADRMVQKFGVRARISIASVVRQLASDPTIFNVPMSFFSPEMKDKPFQFPIIVKESHIRRALSKLSDLLPVQENFRASKVGISNFTFPIIKTPRELLQYIGFGVINKLNVDYIPIIAYNKIVGMPGIFVVDDLRLKEEYSLAASKFQMVYSVGIEAKLKKPKKDEAKELYSSDEYDWRTMTPDFSITNPMVADKLDIEIEKVLTEIHSDIDIKIGKGFIAPLGPTANQIQNKFLEEKGPLAKGSAVTHGKANFRRGDVEAPTADERIRLFHDAGSVDRSGLTKNG